jgi:hypothetical protein
MSDTLPLITYPEGASIPDAVLGCPGGGSLALFDSLALNVSRSTPDGPVIFTIPDANIIGANEAATIQWTPADIGTLPCGFYGLTLIATLAGETQKWRGQLEIRGAS